MKRTLAIIAAGLLAVASYQAQAADPAPAADTAKVEAAVAVDAKVAPATQQFTLKDGSTLTVDDKQMAWTTDASGKNVAAADGDKVTADGKTLTVKDGKVVAGLETKTEEKPADTAPAAGTEDKPADAPAAQ
jgi:hypothetical protein